MWFTATPDQPLVPTISLQLRARASAFLLITSDPKVMAVSVISAGRISPPTHRRSPWVPILVEPSQMRRARKQGRYYAATHRPGHRRGRRRRLGFLRPRACVRAPGRARA